MTPEARAKLIAKKLIECCASDEKLEDLALLLDEHIRAAIDEAEAAGRRRCIDEVTKLWSIQ